MVKQLAEVKSPLKSKTIWAIVGAVAGPLVLNKFGITADDIQSVGNLAVGLGLGLYAIYSRIRATDKLSTK